MVTYCERHVFMFRLFSLLVVWLLLGVGIATQSVASRFESEIAKFHGKYSFSKYAEIKFTNTGLSEPLIFLHSSTGDIPVKAMLVLKSDICTTSLYHDDGSGSSTFKCSSGLELRANYQCSRSSCLLRGDHHQRGKWSLLFHYHNENIDLAETLKFFNGQASTTQIASTTSNPSNTPSSAELLAAQRKADELRQQLTALKAQQEQQQQTISSDIQKPVINIVGTAMNGPQGTIKGYVRDNTGIAEVRVDGKLVEVDSYGNFMANTYVPQSGINVSIEAVDLAGLTSSMSVRLDRLTPSTSTAITFDRLNPLGRSVASNKDALALIIGVNEYAKTPAKAHYADSDAQVFSDYAIQKLGIPANRVKTLVNNNADESGMLLATKRWLARAAKQGKTDVYIFFAGHGLASDDGSKMYLLPYDGAPELLDDTAILRDRLFSDVAAANPRSVTVFLDTCYSGTTRGTDMLIASRPIAIRALKQSIPDNFTVMTAAAGDQTAKPLEEAKHGMFSYFLMKGMEGEADANSDNKITAGELHSYVQTNVIQQSSGSQTPELQGDADRVLVRFQ